MAATSFVSIVVSCDVAVQQDGTQWRVSYCTLSLNGLQGTSLIMPAEANRDRRDNLMKFGACMNKKSSDEQQKCYPMLEG